MDKFIKIGSEEFVEALCFDTSNKGREKLHEFAGECCFIQENKALIMLYWIQDGDYCIKHPNGSFEGLCKEDFVKQYEPIK